MNAPLVVPEFIKYNKEILFTFVGIAGPFFLFGEQMCGKKEL